MLVHKLRTLHAPAVAAILEAEEVLRKTAAILLIAVLVLLGAAGYIVMKTPPQASRIQAVRRTLQAQRINNPITPDGDVSDWPTVSEFTLDASSAQYVGGSVNSELDASLILSAVWDSNYLYVAALVNDDTLVADSSYVWDDDSVEMALDGARDGKCCNADDHQFIAAVDGRLSDFSTQQQGATPVRTGVVMHPNGYLLEMAIPLSLLSSMPIAAGQNMGLNLALNDDDDGGRRDKRLVWVGNTTTDFAAMATLSFSGVVAPQPSRTVTPATPAATATHTATTAATRTPTRTPTTPPTTVPTATPTAVGQPTLTVEQRIVSLEASVTTLEGRVRTILDLLQSAGRFPEATGAGLAAGAATDPRAYVQAVNCGGGAYTTISGDFYAADKIYTAGSWGYLSGQVSQVAQAITGTDDDFLYQSERYNLSAYAFDVPAGTYEVLLRFAETYQYERIGGRVFDAVVEGQTVAKALDILARAGRFAALDMTTTVVVTDGQLNVTFTPSAGMATINAIMVRGVGFAGPEPTPTTGDRLGILSARMTELEGLVAAIIDIFASTAPGVPTKTPQATATPPATPTPVPTMSGPTRTPTPARTATRTPTRTRTVTPGGPTETPHATAKKGVAGGEPPEALRNLGATWSYIWYVAPDFFNTAYEHVPMIWGKDYNAEIVTTTAKTHPGSYWLIWNEPDYWQSANMTPLEAAQAYRVLRPLIKNADPTAKLIVGGVYNLNVGWLESFRSQYRSLYGEWPVVEGWHVHHYVGRTEYDTQLWRTRLEGVRDWMAANGGPTELWITEFGCLNSAAVAEQILVEQTPWLDAQSWVTRYAWYAAFASNSYCPDCSGSLLNSDGSPTNLGQQYRRLP